MSADIVLSSDTISLASLRALWSGGQSIDIDAESRRRIAESVDAIQAKIDAGERIYGVNTGYGALSSVTVDESQMQALQENVAVACAAGTGPSLADTTVRLSIVLKLNNLVRGHSGVRQEIVDALIRMVNEDALPVVPAQGSVGASGDLAPLGHIASTLLGVGEMRVDGNIVPAVEGLRRIGLEPARFLVKEGLALINGTQVSTALALEGLFATERVVAGAVTAGALCVESVLASHTPFDARIHDVRGQPGQIDIAATYRHLFEGGPHRQTYARSQDPYCLRCQPQVMGACLDHLRFAAGVLEREANAITDNPLIFPADDAILSGGNFHAEPVAMASDVMALSIAETGALSERRSAFLVDANMSGLPAFLVRDSGVNCGFMVLHVTAAALASENKSLAHPASVDSLPTSANQEDHVSMAPFAARRLKDMARNTEGVIAIELLAAAQAVDLQDGGPLPERLQQVYAGARERSATMVVDRAMTPDIEAVRAWLQTDEFMDLMLEGLLPSYR